MLRKIKTRIIATAQKIPLLNRVVNKIIFERFKARFRAQNAHNFTIAGSIFILENVAIGRATYGAIRVLDYANKRAKLRIGAFCSIADGVKFLTGGGIT